ncbi:hypothetical protein NBRC116493_05720 [Aurantivibrio infirmus]
MPKILIFGNSGSGKSTLAKKLASEHKCEHLDLDILAWRQTMPPERSDIKEVSKKLTIFFDKNSDWVIEGCYSDIICLATKHASEVIFMNLSIEDCIENAKNRPWEKHKYESKLTQDKNLPMLLDWIKNYNNREDDFSFTSHNHVFETFPGNKKMINKNSSLTPALNINNK